MQTHPSWIITVQYSRRPHIAPQGKSPLHDAASNGHAEVVRALLDRGAAVDATDVSVF